MLDWEHEQFVKNFEEYLLDGEVNPYDYLHNPKYKRCRIILAKHGYSVEELIANDDEDVTATLIQHGYGKEHYKELAKSQHTLIRVTLARAGYYPDLFIFDEFANVRMTVIDKYPEYFRKLLDDVHSTELIQHVLWEYPTPTIDDLERHKTQCLKTNMMTPYLDKKIAALKVQPTPFEETMTAEQLYSLNNPLWARNMTLKEISDFEREMIKEIVKIRKDKNVRNY